MSSLASDESSVLPPATKGASLQRVLMERRKQQKLREKLQREEGERLRKEEEETERSRPGTGQTAGARSRAARSWPRTQDSSLSKSGGTGSVEKNSVPPPQKEVGHGEGAEAIVEDVKLSEGRYDAVVPDYGLTNEQSKRSWTFPRLLCGNGGCFL